MNLFRLAVVGVLLAGCGFKPAAASSDDDDAHPIDVPGTGSDAAIFLGPCGTVGAVRDTFDDNLTADPWNVLTPAQVSETGGELVVTPVAVPNPPGPSVAVYQGYLSKHTVDLTASAVTVEVTGMVDPSSTDAVAEFGVVNTKSMYALIIVGHGMISFQSQDGQPTASVSGAIPYDPVAQRWWRIVHTGGTLSAQVSPDGIAWTTVGTPLPQPAWLTRVGVALGGSSTDLNPHGAVHYDNLDQNVDAAGWCRASSLTDQFQRTQVGIDWNPLSTRPPPQTCTPTVNAGAHFDQSGMGTSRCELTTAQGFDLTNDHVMIYVPSITSTRAGWNPFLRVVSDTVADTFYLQFEHNATDQLCAQVHSDPEQCRDYDPVRDLYWRISETNHVLAFESSPDTVVWTPIGTTAISFAVIAVDIELGTAVTATFAPAVTLVITGYNDNPPL
ncbi:MAG: hypothetical protein ABI704_23765 [Kofleriaceae bacterium]